MIRSGRAGFARVGRGRTSLLGARGPRQDLAKRAAEPGDDLLTGKDIVLPQHGGWAVQAEHPRLPRLGIDYPDQGDAGFVVVLQLLLQVLGRVVRGDNLYSQVRWDPHPAFRRDIPG